MYKVIGHPRTRAVRVLWMLEALGLEYEIDPATPGSDGARAVNPSAKVPTLEVDGVPIRDSVAAITYLADARGQLTHPAGTIERGEQDSLMQLACDEFDQPLWTAAKHRFALPEAVRVPAVKEAARFEWERGCGHLAQRLAGPFAMGEAMTIPDIIFGHCAGWAQNAGFDWPDGPVGAYFARMQGQEALARARAKGDEVLAAAEG